MRPSYNDIKNFTVKEKTYTIDIIKHYDYTMVETATFTISYFSNMDFVKENSNHYLSHWKNFDNVFLCQVKYNSANGTFYAINSNDEYFLEDANRFNFMGNIDVDRLNYFFDTFFKDVISSNRKNKINSLLNE